MRAGAFDRQIVLEAKTAAKVGAGEPIDTWATLATVYAQVLPVSGREWYGATADQLVAMEMLQFRIRWRPGSDVRAGTARIKYQGRIYNIRRVSEIGRNKVLEVDADTNEA